MDTGTVAMVALVAGIAGGAVGAALVGTVEAILRRRLTKSLPSGGWSVTSRHTYVGRERPES